jgi:hypothetical protein
VISDDKSCIERLVKEDRETKERSFCLYSLGDGAPTAMSNVGFHFGKIQDGYLRQPRTSEYQGVIKLHASIGSKAPNDGVAKFYEICC